MLIHSPDDDDDEEDDDDPLFIPLPRDKGCCKGANPALAPEPALEFLCVSSDPPPPPPVVMFPIGRGEIPLVLVVEVVMC